MSGRLVRDHGRVHPSRDNGLASPHELIADLIGITGLRCKITDCDQIRIVIEIYFFDILVLHMPHYVIRSQPGQYGYA